MIVEFSSPELIRVWLKNRKRKHLRSFDNVTKLTLGFVDLDKAEYIHFRLKDMRKDPELSRVVFSLYHKLQKKPDLKQGTLQGWIRAISSY